MFLKNRALAAAGARFLRFRRLGAKVNKQSIKNEVNMGSHLGIYFFLILVCLGGQVGRLNGTNIDANRHRNNDGKKKGTSMAK